MSNESRQNGEPDPLQPLLSGFAATSEAMTLVDARRLWRRLRGLRAVPREALESSIAAWQRDRDRAIAQCARRKASVPAVRYPDLPVSARRDDIVAALRAHQVLVLCGDTGSGKSTQLPKMCLEAGLGVRGAIAHTQPRRIAARSVASRVAEELGLALPAASDASLARRGDGGRGNGPLVGVKTRFDDRTGRDTLLSVMTDGILLAETRHDRDLLEYDTIIVDEAHERSLNIDFLLGYLARLLERRADLKVIVTSATIDPDRFAQHFARGPNPAPIILVEGRTYPIETRYRPLPDDAEGDEDDPAVLTAIAAAVDEIDAAPRPKEGDAATRSPTSTRDILIFLSGEREIRETADTLAGRHRDSDIMPLYARLSADEQDRVFKRSPRRRIVLATNVAETSITVPGIEAVVDPGLARLSRYSPRGRVQRLLVEPISQASADQRRGRCGRTAPGICIRLYGEKDGERSYLARPRFTAPEILRTNLASVILQMASLSLGRPEEFPFLDPPSRRLIEAGYETLRELGAITGRDTLTPIGRRMALLPIDPRLSRILLAAVDERCLAEALVVVAALSVQDPRERPADKAQAADFAQLEFRDERSDFLGFLKLWRAWRTKSSEVDAATGKRLGSSALKRWCRDRFLSWLRMREWADVHRQLRDVLRERIAPQLATSSVRADLDRDIADDPDPNALHRALLVGFVANVGQKVELSKSEAQAATRSGAKAAAPGQGRNVYRTPSGAEFVLHPSSVLAKRTPPWVMSAEIVETSRRFARMCAKIQADWLEKVAPHLCQRLHSEPHWLRDAGQVAAWERVTLGSLTIVPKRRVPFGPVDPSGARDVFIQSALVDGELRTKGTFLAHNANLRAAIEMLEAKGRHANLLVESEARFAFYEARVPDDVHSGPSFEKWRLRAERENPRLLHMTADDLVRRGAATVDADRFPDAIVVRGVPLDLSYRHAPGAEDDGVTVRVPLAAAAHVDPERLAWLVPGLLEEKIAGLIRTLPKRLRVRFQPAAEFSAGAAETLPFGEGRLLDALASHLASLTGVAVEPADFAVASLEPHLVARVVVVDRTGKELAKGRDAEKVLAPYRLTARDEMRRAAAKDPRVRALLARGLRDMPATPIPSELSFVVDGLPFVGYPCLADDGNAVSVRVLESKADAERSHREGVRRLLAIRFASALGHHVDYLTGFDAMALAFAPLGGSAALAKGIGELAIDVAVDAAIDGAPGPAREAASGSNAETPNSTLPRSSEAFEKVAARLESSLHASVKAAAALADPIVRGRQETAKILDAAHPPSWSDAIRRMKDDLAALVPSNVLTTSDLERLRHLPRYLGAIRSRVRKLAGNVERDARLQAEWDAFAARLTTVPPGADPADVSRYRFLLDEFKVQLFAGELRTAVPVSPERLDAAWESLRARDVRGA